MIVVNRCYENNKYFKGEDEILYLYLGVRKYKTTLDVYSYYIIKNSKDDNYEMIRLSNFSVRGIKNYIYDLSYLINVLKTLYNRNFNI